MMIIIIVIITTTHSCTVIQEIQNIGVRSWAGWKYTVQDRVNGKNVV
jgi:hypothetical protein